MDMLQIGLLIILGLALDFITRKDLKVSMVITTTFIIATILIIDWWIYILVFSRKLPVELPLMVKLLFVVLSIMPFIFFKGYFAHTLRIIDYWINKDKILASEDIEKGIITEIKGYGYGRKYTGHYLIVCLNGEKIKSLPFKYHPGGTIVRTTYSTVSNNRNISREKTQDVLGEMPAQYNVGDEIDIIIYNNKKYVKITEYDFKNFYQNYI